jgi:hypothetical protein
MPSAPAPEAADRAEAPASEASARGWEYGLLGALFIAGWWLRWLFSDGDFIGDDAWYFYLARGFGLESGARAEQTWFHIANRPLFYALFHVSTYAGIWGFRLAGCCIGACAPLLAYAAARALGAARKAAALAGCCLCVHRLHLQYSALGFPDVLASGFALAACWAAARRARMACLLLSCASVWSKESFVFVPIIATLLRLHVSGRVRRPDAWAFVTCLLPVAYVATVSAISLHTPGLRMQGWSLTPFTLRHARAMLIGPELWPLLAWLAWRREFRALVLWLGLPAFYLLWTQLLGRGMTPWYPIGAAALASAAAALGVQAVNDACQRAGLSRARSAAWLGLTLLCIAPVPLSGLSQARAQFVQLAGRWPDADAAHSVRSVLARFQTERVVTVDCFWAYRYSHLRSQREPGHAVWWNGAADSGSVLAAAQDGDVIVVCKRPQHGAIQALLRENRPHVLLDDAGWLVLTRAPVGGGVPTR